MGWGVRKYPRACEQLFHTHIPTLCDDGTFKVGVLEEKVKLSNLKNVDSAGSLHRKYQELLKAMQSKDELISQLEAQLEKQVSADCRAAPMPSAASIAIGHTFMNRPPLLEPSVGGELTPS